MKILTFILLTLFLSGCFAHTLNKRNANLYFAAGLNSEKMGNWFDARKAYGRAWTNATLAHGKDEAIAAVAYEYGRASGAICDWDEAKRGLLESYKFHKNTHIPTLVELARMNHAQGDQIKSEEFFILAKKALDRIQAVSVDPIAYADFLAEYVAVLDSLAKHKEAEPIIKMEEEIRNKYKDHRSTSHNPTPYGKFCNQNPQLKPTASTSR